MPIPNLTPVEPWPTRKQPQERFDTAVKTAMDQMSVMVGELNSSFIPAANDAVDTVNTITPDIPAILDAPNQATAAAASAEAAAGSAGAAAESVTSAAREADRAKSEADRAKVEADRAEAIAGVGPATAEKLGLVKPDGTTTKTDEFGTLSVPTFGGSAVGLVPAATPEDAKKVLLGNGTWGSAEDDAAAMTLSEDLILTADSPHTLVLTASASGLSVCLPEPSTMQEGTTFHIIVRPLEDIKLCDYSGQPIKAYPVLTVSTAIRVQLVDASTGLWALSEYKSGSTSDAQGTPGLNIGEMIIFNSAAVGNISVAALSETKALVCYRDAESPYYGATCVLSISGTTVSVGEKTFFDNVGPTNYISVAPLSEDKAVVCYARNDTHLKLLSKVLTIADTTVSTGDELVIISSYQIFDVTVRILSENKAIVGYVSRVSTSHNYLAQSRILNISGTNISSGDEFQIDTSGSTLYFNYLFALTENSALAVYDTNKGVVLTISGTSITAGSEVNLTKPIYMTLLSPSKAVVTTDFSLPTVVVLDISGTNITEGEPVNIYEFKGSRPLIIALSTTKFLVFYKSEVENLGRYMVNLCEVSGSSVIVRGTMYSDISSLDNNLTLMSPTAPTILQLTSTAAGVLFFA